MGAEVNFRRGLFWRLLLSSACYVVGVGLMIRFQHELVITRFILSLLLVSGLYLLKTLLEAGWYDATALPRERSVCRGIVGLLVLCSLARLAWKTYQAVYSRLE